MKLFTDPKHKQGKVCKVRQVTFLTIPVHLKKRNDFVWVTESHPNFDCYTRDWFVSC